MKTAKNVSKPFAIGLFVIASTSVSAHAACVDELDTSNVEYMKSVQNSLEHPKANLLTAL